MGSTLAAAPARRRQRKSADAIEVTGQRVDDPVLPVLQPLSGRWTSSGPVPEPRAYFGTWSRYLAATSLSQPSVRNHVVFRPRARRFGDRIAVTPRALA